MNASREMMIYRAIVTEALKRKGVQFKDRLDKKGLAREVKKLNLVTGIKPKITTAELAIVYLDVLKCLVREHFAQVAEVIGGGSVGRNKKMRPSIPGRAFKS